MPYELVQAPRSKEVGTEVVKDERQEDVRGYSMMILGALRSRASFTFARSWYRGGKDERRDEVAP